MAEYESDPPGGDPEHEVIWLANPRLTWTRDLDLLSITPGMILYLRKPEEVMEQHFVAAKMDLGCLGHPCVVIGVNQLRQKLGVCIITSFGGRLIEETKKPGWVWPMYLPMGDTPMHTRVTFQLQLEGLRKMEKKGYVNTQDLYEVHYSMTTTYPLQNSDGVYRLDKLSFRRVLESLQWGAECSADIEGLLQTSNRMYGMGENVHAECVPKVEVKQELSTQFQKWKEVAQRDNDAHIKDWTEKADKKWKAEIEKLDELAKINFNDQVEKFQQEKTLDVEKWRELAKKDYDAEVQRIKQETNDEFRMWIDKTQKIMDAEALAEVRGLKETIRKENDARVQAWDEENRRVLDAEVQKMEAEIQKMEKEGDAGIQRWGKEAAVKMQKWQDKMAKEKEAEVQKFIEGFRKEKETESRKRKELRAQKCKEIQIRKENDIRPSLAQELKEEHAQKPEQAFPEPTQGAPTREGSISRIESIETSNIQAKTLGPSGGTESNETGQNKIMNLITEGYSWASSKVQGLTSKSDSRDGVEDNGTLVPDPKLVAKESLVYL